MAFKVADRVKESCTSPGTGTVTLLGAVTQYQSFSSAIGANNTTLYVIADQSGANWEVGVGTIGATGTTLARTTVIASSNAGSLVNFSSGSQYVFCDLAAEKALLLDDNGKLQAGLNDYLDWASVQPAVAAGRMWYDATIGSWQLGMTNGNIAQSVGNDQFFWVKASSAITKGQLCMFTGVVGASSVITAAPATGVTDGTYIVGFAAESIALNGFGSIQCFGVLKGLDTSAFASGAILWYDPTVTGGVTSTKPSAPNIKVQVAAVINAGTGGSGSIQIRVSPGSVLGGTDSNVQFGTLVTNNLIQYNGTYWTNVTPGSITGVGSVANSHSAGSGLSGTAFNGSAAVTWTLATAYGDTINPYASKTANYFLAAPNGTAGVPSFRAIVAADIPTLNQNTTGQAGSVANSHTAGSGLSGSTFNGSAAVTWTLATAYGDTINPYASKTANYFLAAPNGSAGVPTFRAIVAADIPSLPPAKVSDQANTSTGYFGFPKGTTAQRPASPATGMIRYNTDFAVYEVYSGSNWVQLSTSPLNFPVDYLVIAGGGAGGGYWGGGGGAGGYREFTSQAIAPGTSVTVTIGGGGSGVNGSSGGKGSDSVFGTITSSGGGGGGYATGATTGGSGGGGGNANGGAAGNTPATTPSQGNSGGNASSVLYVTGGGGGAGSIGGGSSGGTCGSGGSGVASSITGTSVTRAGGGGGGGRAQNGNVTGYGGAGGGGDGGAGGGTTTASNGRPGSANTGGGGGGSEGDGGGTNDTGGNGGSGVVIVRYPDTYPDLSSIGAGLTYSKTTPTGYKVYTFTSGTGTITF